MPAFAHSRVRYAMQLALLIGASACMLAASCDRQSAYEIGVVLDADGRRGATLAAEEVNERGGINGHRIELVRVEGASSVSARIALAAADSLTSNPAILAVVGHTNSGASLAASQIYNARHLVQIAPTSTTPLYSDAGPYSFRMVASDLHQGVFLANAVLAHGKVPRVAVVYVNDDYGRGLRQVLVQRLNAAGVRPVYDAPYAEDDMHAEFDGVVASLARARPDVFVWVGRARSFREIASSLRAALPAISILASDGFGGPELSWDTSGAYTGVRYVRLVDYTRHDSALQALQRRYVTPELTELDDQALLSYDAVKLLAEALRHVGSNREAIRDWLSRVGRGSPPFEGITGPIAFPTGGDRAPAYFMDVVPRARALTSRPLDAASAIEMKSK